MTFVRTTAGIVLVMAVFVLLAGCSKKEAKPASQLPPRTGSGPSPAGRTSSQAAGTITLKPVGSNAAPPAPAPQVRPQPGTPLQGHGRLLSLRGGSAIFPSDYAIGALQPSMPAGTEQGRILKVIRSFFESLAQGKIDSELVSPQWRQELERRLSYPKNKGDLPTSVRIGALRIEEEKADAAIRMEKGDGRASGEVYLELVDGTWYISDIQGDFAELGKPFVRTQPFDPAEWKSLMKE